MGKIGPALTDGGNRKEGVEISASVPLIQFLGGWKWKAVLYLLLTMDETFSECGYRTTLWLSAAAASPRKGEDSSRGKPRRRRRRTKGQPWR